MRKILKTEEKSVVYFMRSADSFAWSKDPPFIFRKILHTLQESLWKIKNHIFEKIISWVSSMKVRIL